MQDYYEQFTAVEGERKATNFWDRKERKRLRRAAKDLRKKGKAAWKQCQQVSKLAEARGEDPLTASLSTGRATLTPRDPMYPDGVPDDSFQFEDPLTTAGMSDFREEEGMNWWLWGGLGAGALVVLGFALKKRKKSR